MPSARSSGGCRLNRHLASAPNSAAQLGLLDGVEVQPRDLVLVLVGHQLEEVARDRLRELRRPGVRACSAASTSRTKPT